VEGTHVTRSKSAVRRGFRITFMNGRNSEMELRPFFFRADGVANPKGFSRSFSFFGE
jgi:hypothetical protein